MITITSPVPQGVRVRCLECDLRARSPIVVATHEHENGGTKEYRGKCSDRKACAMRQRRAANRAKEMAS